MRVLLSSVGTRGDVQPIFALARTLRSRGHDVRLCVPPNFVAWAADLGFEARAVGVEMRATSGASAPLTPERLRELRATMPDLITDQFDAIEPAAEGCDVILGANAHQYAARSIAERFGVPYVTALYAPVAIPSPLHPPPPLPGGTWMPSTAAEHQALWDATTRAWNERALERVNDNRVRRGLPPIEDVLRFNVTDHPWLATDPELGSMPGVFHTGAWTLEDDTPLAGEIDHFLAAGDAVYLGFGSMPAPPDAGRLLIEAARATGLRAIVARGWAALDVADAEGVLVIGDVNQQRLFPRCRAVVHHGGAGTTATAARAGVPQVIVPMFSDQFYWASRVRALGIGTIGSADALDRLGEAIAAALDPAVVRNARSFGEQLGTAGTRIAAECIEKLARRQV